MQGDTALDLTTQSSGGGLRLSVMLDALFKVKNIQPKILYSFLSKKYPDRICVEGDTSCGDMVHQEIAIYIKLHWLLSGGGDSLSGDDTRFVKRYCSVYHWKVCDQAVSDKLN